MDLVYTLPTKVASSIVHVVMQQLSSSVMREIGQIWQVDDKLRELQATYTKIKSKLDKSDCWEINKATLEPWLQDLENYCYETEDLVDDLILSRPIKHEDEKPVQHPLRRQTIRSGRLTVAHHIADLQKKLEVIGSQIDDILSAGASSSKQPDAPLTSSPYYKSLLADKTPLVKGTSRDRDKKSIILELTSLQSGTFGVSITGMDGLGKTALARTILDDEDIKHHFPLILSACVSGHFQIGDIVKKLVAEHSRRTRTNNHHQTVDPQQIHLTLQDLLCSHRTLLVLDDLWDVTDEDWEYFRSNYLNASPGWKILVTTRNPRVAEVTESILFYLSHMTDEDCKKLIIDRAKLSSFQCEGWLTDIETIARKCKGMPIIANKLGLKLSKKHRGDERRATIIQFKTNELWELQEFREVFPSMNFNVPKLRPDLKRCFAYCSLFSPNHEFNRKDLIQLWEAEGFIQPQQTSQCFDDLLSRSILQPCKSRSESHGIYKMHELNHDFAQLLASKAFCRVGNGTDNLLSSYKVIRHLSITCQNTDEPLLKKIEQCKGLRTFLLLHQNKPIRRKLSHSFFHKLEKLRFLDLSHTNITNLPKPMSPSKHLRYLDLSYTEVKKLPEPINFLRALQILKLQNCSKLLQLPKDLNQLTTLKHFHVNMKTLGRLPSNLGKLTNLETFNSFLVGKDEGSKIMELKNMDHLREIHVSGLENIRDREEAQEAVLCEKLLVRTLVLEWGMLVENAGAVLEGLQPHSHLQDLVLRNYCGQSFPSWLISKSCQLVSIHLDNCQNCELLPSVGQLPILKTLVVRSMRNVKIVDNDFCGQGERVFPCLELLEFRDMEQLANWTGLEAGHMPCLRALKIVDCPKLVNLPSLECLSCLVIIEINDCPVLHLLPELPSSLNGELGKLIIAHSNKVRERCDIRGADWGKVKNIPYVEVDATRILTKSSVQANNSDKNNEQDPSFQDKVNGSQMVQASKDQDEFSKKEKDSFEHSNPAYASGASQNNEQDPSFQDKVNGSQMVQNNEQDPSFQDKVNGSQMVQAPKDQDEFSKKEKDSLEHSNPAHESDASQHEETRQPLFAAPRLANEAPPSPENPSFRGLSSLLRGCFSDGK